MDIKDLYRDEKDLTPREASDLIICLPIESRLVRNVSKSEGEFNREEHLLATLIDCLNDISFFSSISAAGAAGKEYKNLMKDRPKPMKRPEDPRKAVEAKKKIRFMTGRELVKGVGGEVTTGRRPRNHTIECKKAQAEGTRKGACGCPRIQQ